MIENKWEYTGWLTSNNTAKRAVAVVGHNILWQIIITVCIWIPAIILISLIEAII